MRKPWIKATKGGTLFYNRNTKCLEFILSNKVVAYLNLEAVKALNDVFKESDSFVRKFRALNQFDYSEDIVVVKVSWLPKQNGFAVSSALGTVELDEDFPEYIKELSELSSVELDEQFRNILLSLPMSGVRNCETNEELVELVERCL